MKKLLTLTLFFAISIFSVQASASFNGNPKSDNSRFFTSIEESTVAAEMADLNALDAYVTDHQGTTLNQMVSENNNLVSNQDAVNGLGVESALQKGDGMPTWALVLIIVGGVLLLVLVLCCLLGSLGSSVE